MKTWMLLPLFVLAAIATILFFLAGRLEKVAKHPAAKPPVESPSPRPPNVILISMDTTRPDHLGCYGYAKNTSPNLDRFVSSPGAVLYKNARSQAPWTLPSHMSLFTSMLPSHNGVDNINQVLPAEVPTLAQVLKESGYRTAALVNNGQMKAHWGFDKGFEEWREFEVDTPQGNCENITSEALRWLEARGSAKPQAGDEPFFLFVHYYDAHDPYAAPEPFARAMGTTLSGEQARAIVEEFREPGRNIENPALKANLIAAYDAELAWVDNQLGRLFEHIPPNTLVVIFSDHGEAFEEHGWTLHGATVYEEETRVLLAIRPQAGVKPPPKLVDGPVMLMDVAPTILKWCGVRPPATFEGVDVGRGAPASPRLIPSETKAVLEGRLSRGLVAEPWKAVYSLFEGKFELYKLPDEITDLAVREPAAAKPLFDRLRAWMAEEEYWMLYAHGGGDFEATLTASDDAPFALFIPVAMEPDRDSLETSHDGKTIHWIAYPRQAPGGVKALFIQPAHRGTALRFDLKINGDPDPARVFLGARRSHPDALPVNLSLDGDTQSPVIESPGAIPADGFYIQRFRGPTATSRPSKVEMLDEQTLHQLRSLGYVR